MSKSDAAGQVDPKKLRIKSREEAAATLAEMSRIDRGFISSPRLFYLVYILLILTLVFRFYYGTLLVGMLLLADWIVFRVRRRRVLARAAASPLRLRSVEAMETVDDLYRREGKAQPTMSDWVELAREARGAAEAGGADFDAERYLDILKAYRRIEKDARVVVDVGANDGRAYYEFGIGAGKVFVGIDISRLLLEEFRRRAPGQPAVQADGIDMPLVAGSVDFLFCTETLEHLSDPAKAVREFSRVLRTGGRLMIQSPNAHRIRNLNPFHIVVNAAGLVCDRVLQKKVVHENTWHNAATYHWDFSTCDYRRMARQSGLRVIELRSRQFFFPRFLLGGHAGTARVKERVIGSIPLLRMMGDDLVLVAEAREIE